MSVALTTQDGQLYEQSVLSGKIFCSYDTLPDARNLLASDFCNCA